MITNQFWSSPTCWLAKKRGQTTNPINQSTLTLTPCITMWGWTRYLQNRYPVHCRPTGCHKFNILFHRCRIRSHKTHFSAFFSPFVHPCFNGYVWFCRQTPRRWTWPCPRSSTKSSSSPDFPGNCRKRKDWFRKSFRKSIQQIYLLNLSKSW